MTFRIPKGKHRVRPLRFGLWWNRNHFKWSVLFTESCRYDLKTDDQFDTNKLVGVGYLRGWFRPAKASWWKLWAYHHKDSARFGWRYWTDRGEVELSAYCYVNGRRVIQHIGFCEVNKWYNIRLRVTHRSYLFELEEVTGKSIGVAVTQHNHSKKLQYRLGLYFGGNATAPTEMHIKIEKP